MAMIYVYNLQMYIIFQVFLKGKMGNLKVEFVQNEDALNDKINISLVVCKHKKTRLFVYTTHSKG